LVGSTTTAPTISSAISSSTEATAFAGTASTTISACRTASAAVAADATFRSPAIFSAWAGFRELTTTLCPASRQARARALPTLPAPMIAIRTALSS
jgi:hypothetical protein